MILSYAPAILDKSHAHKLFYLLITKFYLIAPVNKLSLSILSIFDASIFVISSLHQLDFPFFLIDTS